MTGRAVWTLRERGAYPFEVSVVCEHGNKTRTESQVLVVNRNPKVHIINEKNLAEPFFEPNKGYVTGYQIDESSLYFYTMSAIQIRKDAISLRQLNYNKNRVSLLLMEE